jgi:two-component system OmpR family sensor kinase
VRLDVDGPIEVVGDEARIRQVFDNLLGNVRSHTPPGTDAVVRIVAENGDIVTTVTDTGPGMDDEQRGRVFERFYRGEASRTRVEGGGGAGLGLAIVAAIVNAHGGTVSVDSAEGRGTTFTVRLPRGATSST